ncbi:bromodomain-containing protein DDB_G0280777-like isoform X2 [Perognathus longimembris pacificus]|uniref:bromodomain-containing protein DDB_G0280777-like isoform X2 n=1 Tax=Perognathus longimembris pacificus TaxID=214514 RepID=UPI0020199757|nr:bromodomain-containing protein DDB_G0280777-like isoform X2 [Perognathus longimembris pacificus]
MKSPIFILSLLLILEKQATGVPFYGQMKSQLPGSSYEHLIAQQIQQQSQHHVPIVTKGVLHSEGIVTKTKYEIQTKDLGIQQQQQQQQLAQQTVAITDALCPAEGIETQQQSKSIFPQQSQQKTLVVKGEPSHQLNTLVVKGEPSQQKTLVVKGEPSQLNTLVVKGEPSQLNTLVVKGEPSQQNTLVVKGQPSQLNTLVVKGQPSQGSTLVVKGQPSQLKTLGVKGMQPQILQQGEVYAPQGQNHIVQFVKTKESLLYQGPTQQQQQQLYQVQYKQQLHGQNQLKAAYLSRGHCRCMKGIVMKSIA